MMKWKAVRLAVALCATAGPAYAQGAGTFTYRVRAAEEVTTSRWDALSRSTHLFAASGDATLDWRDRLKVGAAFGVLAGSEDLRLRAREAYVRWAALPWMDLEGGRRIVRWGTGYGFTPTGVLDPPRDPGDPQDRLGMSEGVSMAKADVYLGPTSATVVGAEKRQAARVRTAVGGVEVAAIAAVDSGAAPVWGGNFTHVIGQRFEWHGELLSHEAAARRRAATALIGGQYTIGAAANVVVEYLRTPGTDVLFTRISRGQGTLRISPDVIVVHAIGTREMSVVPTVAVLLGDRADAYVRAAFAGSLRRRTVTAGLGVRF